MPDIIDSLAALDDAALAAKLGFAAKTADFRKSLEEAKTLPEEARKEIADSISRQLQPSIWPGDLAHQVECAKRKLAKKTAVDEMNDSRPESLVEYDD